MRKHLCILVTCILCVCLCGCTSEAAENVMGKIDALEEISISQDELIDNFSESLATMKEKASELDEIFVEYSALEDKEKEQVTNFDKYELVQNQYNQIIDENASDIYIVALIQDYEDRELMKLTLDIFGEKMPSEQKQELYAQYVFYEEAPEYLDNYIQQSLLSPSSYRRYSVELTSFLTPYGNGKFSGTFKVRFGASNAYGAEVTKTVSGMLTFSVNVENGTIRFTDVFMM